VIVARHLLWIDCGAGALAGVAALILYPWLAALYALPPGAVIALGVANLCYAAGSFSLARRAARPAPLVAALAAANLGWAVVCVVLAVAFLGSVTWFGLAHLLGEAVFVGGLGTVEWRHRRELRSAA
jgi:hypothetical protein